MYRAIFKSIISKTLFLVFIFSARQSLAGIFYVDPVNGDINNPGSIDLPWSTIQEVIEANYIMSYAYAPLPYDPVNSILASKNSTGYVTAGDTLVLMDGLHGEIFLRNYVNDNYITVLGLEGAEVQIEKIHLQACKFWRFENLEVSTEPYGYYLKGKLIHVESHAWHGPCSEVEIKSCKIYSADTPWDTADGWLDNASSGIHLLGDHMLAIENEITNIDHGLFAIGDYINANKNIIINFSGDGMRPLGSFIEFNGNLIKNCYDVDDNHDDGIQSYTTGGLVVDNVSILNNIIINSDDLFRPLNGPLQGIGCFDGFYNNWLIANNVVSVNHWHGISLYGANNCFIINNTVIDPTPDIEPGASWIRIDPAKDGTASTDNFVVNNVTNKVVAPGFDFSNVILSTYIDYNGNFTDFQKNDFSLVPESVLIDAADIGYSSSHDIIGNMRDEKPDIGAFEFLEALYNSSLDSKPEIIIFPNPFSEQINIQIDCVNIEVEILNLEGKVIHQSSILQLNSLVHTLKSGSYFIKLIDTTKTCFEDPVIKKIIKIN